MKELLQALPVPKQFRSIKHLPATPTKGDYVITNDNHIGKVVHVGKAALTIRVWLADPEGYLTPSSHPHNSINTQHMYTLMYRC